MRAHHSLRKFRNKKKHPTLKAFDITSTCSKFQKKCRIKGLAKAARSVDYPELPFSPGTGTAEGVAFS